MICMYIFMYACIQVREYSSMCMYVCMIYMCMCVCVFEREGHTERDKFERQLGAWEIGVEML